MFQDITTDIIPKFDEKALKLFNTFTSEYEIIANYHFDSINRRTFLGLKITHCRFCKRSFPEVTFNTTAHTFPQFIGNKYLISKDECDSCNKLFNETLENEMANFMKLFHTIYQVKGETKIPTFKNKDMRMESNASNMQISGN